MPLIATLHIDQLDPCDALPVLSDPGGAWVAIPWECAPDVPEGTLVDVVLEADQAAFRAEAIVLAQQPEADALELHLGWLDPQRVRLRMPGAVAEALADNSERFGNPVRAALATHPPRGHLLDLSSTAVTLAFDTAVAPAPGAQHTLHLDLADGGPPAQPHGRVVARHVLSDDEVAITFLFTGAERPLARLADRVLAQLSGRRSRREAL